MQPRNLIALTLLIFSIVATISGLMEIHGKMPRLWDEYQAGRLSDPCLRYGPEGSDAYGYCLTGHEY